MKRVLLIITGFLFVALFLCRCVICKMRWSDSKATSIFSAHHVPIQFFDTVINGHHIHYAVTGQASLPTLVIIHGSPGSWFHYMKFMRDSAMQTKFRMVVFDRPGFGYSDYGEAMHLQDQCKLLLPVIQSLKTDKPMFLCGHSYGGPVVTKLAADAPDLFKKVVIVAGAIDPAQEKKETWRHIMDYKPLNWFLPGVYQTSNTELLYLKKDLYPLANDLQNIKTDVLFVHGDKDTWVPIENVAYGIKMMTHAHSIQVDTLHGADHQIPWKNREELKQILLRLE